MPYYIIYSIPIYKFWAPNNLVFLSVIVSCFQFFVTSWTIAHQTPLSMEFSRQEYWSGQPFPSSGDLLNPGIKPGSLQADSLRSEPSGKPSLFLPQYFLKLNSWAAVLVIDNVYPSCNSSMINRHSKSSDLLLF